MHLESFGRLPITVNPTAARVFLLTGHDQVGANIN